MENLSDEVGSTRAMVFGALTEMLKQESLIVSFQGFTELIILKVLEAHRDEEKDVSLKKLLTTILALKVSKFQNGFLPCTVPHYRNPYDIWFIY